MWILHANQCLQNSERGSLRHQVDESEEALSLSRKRKASEILSPVYLGQGPRFVSPKRLEQLYAFYRGFDKNWRANLNHCEQL